MLRTVLFVVAAGASALAAPAAPRRADGQEARMAKALNGLTPGAPQACINPSPSQSGTRYGSTLLVKDRQGILYRTELGEGCHPRVGDTLIARRPGTRSCRGDIVEYRDLVTDTFSAACSYGDFIPYRRAR